MPLRKDQMHLGFVLAGAIFLVISTVQGTAFMWFAKPWVDVALDRGGRWADGLLLGTEVVAHEHYGSLHPTLFIYRFEVEEEGRLRDLEGRSKTLDPGQVPVGSSSELRVLYLPDHPTWNRAEGTRFSLFPRWALAIPVLMFMAGLAFLKTGIGGRQRIRRILVRGEQAPGVILGSKPIWYMKKKRTGQKAIRVSFQHSHPFGELRTGQVTTFREDLVQAIPPGTSVRLLVLRDRPQDVVVLELLDAGEILG